MIFPKGRSVDSVGEDETCADWSLATTASPRMEGASGVQVSLVSPFFLAKRRPVPWKSSFKDSARALEVRRRPRLWIGMGRVRGTTKEFFLSFFILIFNGWLSARAPFSANTFLHWNLDAGKRSSFSPLGQRNSPSLRILKRKIIAASRPRSQIVPFFTFLLANLLRMTGYGREGGLHVHLAARAASPAAPMQRTCNIKSVSKVFASSILTNVDGGPAPLAGSCRLSQTAADCC
jgi:hypothetical protein